MKHILVTGGAGFIGSNLISALLGKYQVTAIDNFDDAYPRQQKELNLKSLFKSKNFTFLEGDIRNMSDLEKILNVDIIINLAARAGVRPSVNNPILYQEINVNGLHNLLEFAKLKGIKKFIFTSSSSVYGTNINLPWDENEELLPISPYASTKLSGEALGETYSKLYGINFIGLRLFSVYGPRLRPDLAIHKFFTNIIENKPITVFGDGSTTRDYTFISDIIEGIIAALDYDRTNFEIINLGNHQAVCLSDLIKLIEDICCKKATIHQLPEQYGDAPRTCANILKAQNLLGYSPKISLENGLEQFHYWFMSESRYQNV